MSDNTLSHVTLDTEQLQNILISGLQKDIAGVVADRLTALAVKDIEAAISTKVESVVKSYLKTVVAIQRDSMNDRIVVNIVFQQ